MEYLKVPATYSLSLGDTTIFNLTAATDIFDGISKSLGSLTSSQTSSIENVLQNLTPNEVSNWKSLGLNQLICSFPTTLSDALRVQAGCPDSKTATTTASLTILSSSSSTLTSVSTTGSVLTTTPTMAM